MRTPRIFVDATLTTGLEYIIEGQAAHHISRVLRLSVNAPLIMFNNTGYEFAATISDIRKDKVTAVITEQHQLENTSPINITLVQALAKGEKMDFIVQKATELGVSRVLPVATARSVSKLSADKIDKKIQHWEKVMISACEQSGRTRLVDILTPCSLSEALNIAAGSCAIYFDPLSTDTLSNIPPQKNVTFFIGPEGGFSDEEISTFKNRDFQGIQFGSRILRTETAAIATLSAAGALWGDLG